ncbi:MAG TPA: hypothetical protein VNT99_20945 [Methylomirabilota bacterium]|nr:hypothetical protein [Methylomirabilota bacterium]
MKQLLQILTFLLALAWVPITSHCDWEGLVGGELFKCAPNTAQTGDCSDEDDGCVTVESGSYKVPDTVPEVPAPVFAVVLFELPIFIAEPLGQPAPERAAPDEIPASWLFFSRTALPPRAPSLVS